MAVHFAILPPDARLRGQLGIGICRPVLDEDAAGRREEGRSSQDGNEVREEQHRLADVARMLDTKQRLAAGGDHVRRARIVSKSVEGDPLSASKGGFRV